MTTEQTAPPHTNRLIHETSPYLLQHAHNPVDWYPWGEEALRRAREDDKPILLSIGYSACHWCHVMERESFEDDQIAELMNRHFVCVKVDREERPDLDEIYMAATQALNAGQGGWPMTVFLTPDLEPFFAGTYFPPTDRYGRPGFATLLRHIARAWERSRDELVSQAGRLTEHLRHQMEPALPLAVGAVEMEAAAAQYARTFDPVHGGFGPAPKFPPATGLSLLLRQHRRTGDENALRMVRKTLDAMAAGGMYDQIGGGFHRYATDERWLVPHFEKMLYDNALLAKVYVEGWQATGDENYRRVAAEVLDYVLREMTGPEGGFYSATDADSEGVEGKFFVWTPGEIEEVLGYEEARRFCAYYDITERGNWEGKSIPNVRRTLEQVAAALEISREELRRSLDAARPKVYEARRRRVPPGLDDKVLTAWNGLMIGAMAEGHRVLRDRRYLEAASRAADFLLRTLVRPDGGLLRTYRAGKAHLDGYLEDYAYLTEGLVDLYEAGGEVRYLFEAQRLAERMLADFGDDQTGGFYSTARGHENLLFRHREGTDGATPSGNAVAAHVLARLSHHFDRSDYRDAAVRAVTAYGRTIAKIPRAFSKTLIVVDFLLETPVELAFVGDPEDVRLEALWREVGRQFVPNRIVGHADPVPAREHPTEAPSEPASEPRAATAVGSGDGHARPLPLLAGKGLVDGAPALYVCRSFACQAPVTDAAQVASALGSFRSEAAAPAASIVGTARGGSATAGGTAGYAARFIHELGAEAYGALGGTGLTVSRLGFGAYRVDDETPEHRDALELALGSGVNLLDTSTNYTDGGSERLIGAALAEIERAGRLRREEVVVVSKIGYVQGTNLDLAREREAAGRPFPEMVKVADEVWHCIHPEFLRDQLGRSLARLGLETLDVCLLHNPEYFLSDASRRGTAAAQDVRNEFYRRVREAFGFFETQVAERKLRWYGVSSNSVANPAGTPDETSLTRMLAAAREAGGADHHFRVLQLPMNLFEAGAVRERKEGPEGRETVLELAERESVGVLINRPLNAFRGNRLVRLAEVAVEPAGGRVHEQLDVVRDLEEEYRRRIAPRVRLRRKGGSAADAFRWAETLRALGADLHGIEQWEQIEGQVVVGLTRTLAAFEAGLQGEALDDWRAWRDRYVPALQELMTALASEAGAKSRARSAAIAECIDPLLPADRRRESLSRKALWVLASTPGVSAVLNGMRSPEYVRDAVEVLRWPRLREVGAVYEAVRGLAE